MACPCPDLLHHTRREGKQVYLHALGSLDKPVGINGFESAHLGEPMHLLLT